MSNWIALASAAINAYSSYKSAKENKKAAEKASEPQLRNTFTLPYGNQYISSLIPYILQSEQQVFENRMKGYGAKAPDFSAFAQLLAGISPGYTGVDMGGPPTSPSMFSGPLGPPGGAGQAPNYGYYGQSPMNQATERGAIDKGKKGGNIKSQQAAGGVYGWSGGGPQDNRMGQPSQLPNGFMSNDYIGQLPFPYGGFAGYMDSQGNLHNMPAWGNEFLKYTVGVTVPAGQEQMGPPRPYSGSIPGGGAGLTHQEAQNLDNQNRQPWMMAGNYGANAGGGYGSGGGGGNNDGYYSYLANLGYAY